MTASVLDRLGLGAARAVANARDEALRPEREERLVAALMASLARHGVACGPGTSVVEDPSIHDESRVA